MKIETTKTFIVEPADSGPLVFGPGTSEHVWAALCACVGDVWVIYDPKKPNKAVDVVCKA